MTSLAARFEAQFERKGRLFHAPGRVNLIGEHTDYNDGFVMPAAIGFETAIAAAPREDRILQVHSENVNEMAYLDLDALHPRSPPHWSKFVSGVAWVLERDGLRLRGADMLIVGDVPIGAGLSSSASIEVAAGLAFLELGGHSVDRTRLALQCQRAENEYVGMRCGVMDQFIACYGQTGHALMLDCRSLDFALLPVPPDARIVICNTMVRHELTGGEYNERRADCEEGVRLLSAQLPGVHALRDVTPAMLEPFASTLPPRIFRRCRHVVSENVRVLEAADDLRRGDLSAFGARMAASHASLRDDYEVSCAELDLMVSLAVSAEGVHGARMTGGGFGGCTVNLVERSATEAFVATVGEAYRQQTGIQPDIYVCTASGGARVE